MPDTGFWPLDAGYLLLVKNDNQKSPIQNQKSLALLALGH